MAIDLHHVHVLASDIEATIEWWRRHLEAKVLFDGNLAGSRNVLIAVGCGRLNIYDQPPRDSGRGAVQHVGERQHLVLWNSGNAILPMSIWSRMVR